MDIIRSILLTINDCDEPTVQTIKLDEYPQKVVNYHVNLLGQAKFITGSHGLSSGAGHEWIDVGLSWEGHEFIDNAQDEETWSKLKTLVAEKGGSVSLAVISNLLVALTKQSFGLT